MNYRLQAQRYIRKKTLESSPLRGRLERRRAAQVAGSWKPLPGPQTAAMESSADIVGYGGQAGGGKTDLLIGCALSARRAMVFRREYAQLDAIEYRSRELLAGKGRYNGAKHTWTLPNGVLRFGACQRIGDEFKFQGWPRDFVGVDEAAHFAERQILTLLAWLRSTAGDRVRAILAFNPPTSADGLWLLRWFAPWIDPDHPNPAAPGEIRWFARIGDRDTEVPGPGPVPDGSRMVVPLSRTFIPATLQDNPYLAGTNYEALLDQLPEPLRSQMRYGDFRAGLQDDAWQLIPSAWLKAAMDRWRGSEAPIGVPATLGVDVARGGADRTAIAKRTGWHVARLAVYPGSQTPDGGAVAALVELEAAEMGEPAVNVDVIGYGSSAYDTLTAIRSNVYGVNVAEGSSMRDRSGRLGMVNKRAEMYWRLREALDPAHGARLAIPPDEELREELLAHRWSVTAGGILIESKELIEERIGRSPDLSDALALSMLEAPTLTSDEAMAKEFWADRRLTGEDVGRE